MDGAYKEGFKIVEAMNWIQFIGFRVFILFFFLLTSMLMLSLSIENATKKKSLSIELNYLMSVDRILWVHFVCDAMPYDASMYVWLVSVYFFIKLK